MYSISSVLEQDRLAVGMQAVAARKALTGVEDAGPGAAMSSAGPHLLWQLLPASTLPTFAFFLLTSRAWQSVGAALVAPASTADRVSRPRRCHNWPGQERPETLEQSPSKLRATKSALADGHNHISRWRAVHSTASVI